MKNIIIIAFIVFMINAKAQIVMEQDYDSAATWNVPNSRGSQLMVINFEASGERIVKICRVGKYISIYNLNHTLIKTISLANVPLTSLGFVNDVLYLSEHLFDNDDEIEFLYSVQPQDSSGTTVFFTGIYNEDGIIIFSENGYPWIRTNVQLQQYPIYNTSQGTKMILSYENGHAKVFSLPGTLSTSIAEANGQLMQMQGGQGQFSGLYPNPGNGSVTLQYELPMGEPNGEIVLFDLQGAEVKRYNVDNTFNDVLLDNTMLPAGTYFYQLVTARGAVGTKKSIVVK